VKGSASRVLGVFLADISQVFASLRQLMFCTVTMPTAWTMRRYVSSLVEVVQYV